LFTVTWTEIGLAQGSNRAAIVVRFGEDRQESRCVAFEEPEISGLELLQRSGLNPDLDSGGMGSLLCRIEETGCPPDDCWCQCKGGDSCVYWSYWRQLDESWIYAQVGASSTKISDGAVDGWSWGPGTIANAIEPAEVSFDEVCSDDATLVTRAAENGSESSFNWRPILAFGLIIIGLGLVGLALKRQRSA
jgi:hypothetical protein